MKIISTLFLSFIVAFSLIINVEASEKTTITKEVFTDKEIESIILKNTDLSDVEIETEINSTTNEEVICESSIVDVPITNLSSTTYIIGLVITSTGLYLLEKNVKKQKNNS